MKSKKMYHKRGGFNTNPENIKKAIEAKRKKLGRKPRTAKEHEEWRKNQRKKFKLW
jgi:hypothetical protein